MCQVEDKEGQTVGNRKIEQRSSAERSNEGKPWQDRVKSVIMHRGQRKRRKECE